MKKSNRPIRNLGYCLSFFVFLIFIGTALGQDTKTVSGTVYDDSNIPLPGANVTVPGKPIGTTSDFDGNYSIAVADSDTLVFSYLGFLSQTISVEGKSNVDIYLQPDAQQLDDVVVIGYGTQSRKKITSAVAEISTESIEDVPVATVGSAVQGKISGVRVFHGNGGQPGASPTFTVRGGSSINRSNNPLIIVDGLPRDFDNINPNDVESIEVLKDAAATSIYGARASNGVVLITTKKGRSGKAEINFDMSAGTATTWKKHKLVDAATYLSFTRPALVRSADADILNSTHSSGTDNGPNSPWSPRILEPGQAVPAGYQSMPDPIDPTRTLIFEDNDFQDIAFRTALEQNYYLSANGGTDKIKYYTGLGWTDHEGVAISTEYRRFSAQSNVDFKLSDKLELQTRINISRSLRDAYDSQRSIFTRSIWMAPTGRVFLEDGSFAPGNNATYTNPLFFTDVRQGQTFEYRTAIGGSLIWKPFTGLSLQARGDYFNRNETEESFLKANVYDNSRPATYISDLQTSWQTEALANYDTSINGSHNIGILLGFSALDIENLDTQSSAFGGSTDQIQTLNAAPTKTEASTFRTREVLNGLFSRLTYDYDGKYLLSASIRRDGSSRLGERKRIGYFSSFSAGWAVSEEAFMGDIKNLDFLKLRGSWGQTGNNDVGINDAAGIYAVGNNYNFEPGALPVAIPNQNLAWETTNQWNAGLDLGIFNNRIRLLADVYGKTTQNLIFVTPLPNTSGFDNIVKNIGMVRFSGWEFEIHTKNIVNGLFKWESDITYNYSKNEVLELPDNGRSKNRIGGIINPDTGEGVGGIAEGEQLFSIVGYQNDFIIDTQEQADNAHFDTEARGYSPVDGESVRGRKFPGDWEWVDRDGNGIINVLDQDVLGFTVPHTTGGVGNTFTYKGIELNIFMDFALGHSISDQTIRRGDGNVIGGQAIMTTNILKSWMQEGDIASGRSNFPRFDFNDAQYQRNIHRGGIAVSESTYDASYLNLREIKLGYNLSQNLTESIGLRTAKIYIAGQNLHYFTEYPGLNPEYTTGNNNIDDSYPLARKIIFGLKIGF